MQNRVINYIKENYKSYYFSLGICILFLIVFNLLFLCRYHTVDDAFMEMIACGAYGSPDEHLIYSNSILGFILKYLYMMTNSIPWYGIMHLVLTVLSFSIILYVFFNKNNKLIKIWALIAIFVCCFQGYMRVQFTKTSAYLAMAGYILIAHSFDYEKRKTKQTIGIIMIVLSFMIRTGMFFACSTVAVGTMIPMILRWLRNRNDEKTKSDFKNLVKVALISMLLVGGSFFIDSLSYRSKEWSYYKEFNSYTTQFEDVNFPSFDKYEKQYLELGIDKEDFMLYNSVDHNDPDLFGIDTMEKVRQLQPYIDINFNQFKVFLSKGYENLFKLKSLKPFTTMFFMIMIIFVISKQNHNFVDIVSLIYVILTAFVAFAYSYFMHGWYDRISIGIMMVVIFTILYFLKPNYNKYLSLVSGMMIIILIAVCATQWRSSLRIYQDDFREEYKINHEVLDFIYDDKDHLYISRTSLVLWKKYYTPYDQIKTGAMSNYSPLGDWIANMPLLVETLERYNVRNPYKDIVNNDKVYFIGNDDNLALVETYIRKHYYSNLQVNIVNKIGPYTVYSFISNGQ